MNPNPICEKDCRFVYGPATATCVYYTPVYDKHGNSLNPDGNTTRETVTCKICNKAWVARTRYGKTEFEEQTN